MTPLYRSDGNSWMIDILRSVVPRPWALLRILRSRDSIRKWSSIAIFGQARIIRSVPPLLRLVLVRTVYSIPNR